MAALAAASGGALGALTRPASARQDDLRAADPEDPRRRQGPADRCRLAEGRRAVPRPDQGQRQAEGEFAGVELTFMGLNNQNLHNVLFRGFLKPWEDYTGAKINWIDLAQADYNARLQQAIATGTVDFDIMEMGAPFEGDVCGKGLLVRDARLGQARRSTWTTTWTTSRRPSAPGTARRTASPSTATPHLRLPHRLFTDADAGKDAWKADGRRGRLGRRRRPGSRSGGDQVPQGQADSNGPATSTAISTRSRRWGGFGFYFLGRPRHRLRQASRTTRPGCSTRTR